MTQRLCILGECMLEVSAASLTGRNAQAGLSYGGDTLNTALYYARLGGQVNYLSALGDDSLSDWMIDSWGAEGVGCSFVRRLEGAAPGLYLIQVDNCGERSFVYWRENSAARTLLQEPRMLARLLIEATEVAEVLYLSGITLALMNPESRSVLFDIVRGFRKSGGLLAFDSNHRPKLWSDSVLARDAYEQMYGLTDIALATAEDEYNLFGGDQPAGVVERLCALGVGEMVVKAGQEGALLYADQRLTQVPAMSANVVDTTAAGDSFNAAYLVSRASGLAPVAAVEHGHRLASTVIGHRGAIIPDDAMPVMDGLAQR